MGVGIGRRKSGRGSGIVLELRFTLLDSALFCCSFRDNVELGHWRWGVTALDSCI